MGAIRRKSELRRKLALLNAPCLRNRRTICLRGRWEGGRSLPKSDMTWKRAECWDEGRPRSTKNQRVKEGIIVSGPTNKNQTPAGAAKSHSERSRLFQSAALAPTDKNDHIVQINHDPQHTGRQGNTGRGEAKTVAQPRICPTVGESSCQPLRLPEDRANTRGEAGGGQATVRSANRHHEQHNSRGRESGNGRDQKTKKKGTRKTERSDNGTVQDATIHRPSSRSLRE